MSFRVATLKSGHNPPTREFPVAAAEAWTDGALLLQDAAGAWAECGADPAVIGAVAQGPYGGTVSLQDHTGGLGVPPGRAVGTLVRDETEFSAMVIGGVGLVAIGTAYGVAVDADGLWKVDPAELVATRLTVVRLLDLGPGTPNRVVVKFLAANCQLI